jgi:hypothetical protein
MQVTHKILGTAGPLQSLTSSVDPPSQNYLTSRASKFRLAETFKIRIIRNKKRTETVKKKLKSSRVKILYKKYRVFYLKPARFHGEIKKPFLITRAKMY